MHGWTQWVTHQSLFVRGLIGFVGLLFAAGMILAYDVVIGVPSWVPVL